MAQQQQPQQQLGGSSALLARWQAEAAQQLEAILAPQALGEPKRVAVSEGGGAGKGLWTHKRLTYLPTFPASNVCCTCTCTVACACSQGVKGGTGRRHHCCSAQPTPRALQLLTTLVPGPAAGGQDRWGAFTTPFPAFQGIPRSPGPPVRSSSGVAPASQQATRAAAWGSAAAASSDPGRAPLQQLQQQLSRAETTPARQAPQLGPLELKPAAPSPQHRANPWASPVRPQPPSRPSRGAATAPAAAVPPTAPGGGLAGPSNGGEAAAVDTPYHTLPSSEPAAAPSPAQQGEPALPVELPTAGSPGQPALPAASEAGPASMTGPPGAQGTPGCRTLPGLEPAATPSAAQQGGPALPLVPDGLPRAASLPRAPLAATAEAGSTPVRGAPEAVQSAPSPGSSALASVGQQQASSLAEAVPDALQPEDVIGADTGLDAGPLPGGAPTPLPSPLLQASSSRAVGDAGDMATSFGPGNSQLPGLGPLGCAAAADGRPPSPRSATIHDAPDAASGAAGGSTVAAGMQLAEVDGPPPSLPAAIHDVHELAMDATEGVTFAAATQQAQAADPPASRAAQEPASPASRSAVASSSASPESPSPTSRGRTWQRQRSYSVFVVGGAGPGPAPQVIGAVRGPPADGRSGDGQGPQRSPGSSAAGGSNSPLAGARLVAVAAEELPRGSRPAGNSGSRLHSRGVSSGRAAGGGRGARLRASPGSDVEGAGVGAQRLRPSPIGTATDAAVVVAALATPRDGGRPAAAGRQAPAAGAGLAEPPSQARGAAEARPSSSGRPTVGKWAPASGGGGVPHPQHGRPLGRRHGGRELRLGYEAKASAGEHSSPGTGRPSRVVEDVPHRHDHRRPGRDAPGRRAAAPAPCLDPRPALRSSGMAGMAEQQLLHSRPRRPTEEGAGGRDRGPASHPASPPREPVGGVGRARRRRTQASARPASASPGPSPQGQHHHRRVRGAVPPAQPVGAVVVGASPAGRAWQAGATPQSSPTPAAIRTLYRTAMLQQGRRSLIMGSDDSDDGSSVSGLYGAGQPRHRLRAASSIASSSSGSNPLHWIQRATQAERRR